MCAGRSKAGGGRAPGIKQRPPMTNLSGIAQAKPEEDDRPENQSLTYGKNAMTLAKLNR